MQAVKHDGTREKPEPFDKKKMETKLKDPEVRRVEVFKPKVGMVVNFGDKFYKVCQILPGGFKLKATKKPDEVR